MRAPFFPKFLVFNLSSRFLFKFKFFKLFNFEFFSSLSFQSLKVNNTHQLCAAGASGSQTRATDIKLDSHSSEEEAGRNSQSPTAQETVPCTTAASQAADGASSNTNGAVSDKPATTSTILSSDAAQRLKAQAAESGLHTSDSGLASKLSMCVCVCVCVCV